MLPAPLQGALSVSDTFAIHFFKEQLIVYAAIFFLYGKITS